MVAQEEIRHYAERLVTRAMQSTHGAGFEHASVAALKLALIRCETARALDAKLVDTDPKDRMLSQTNSAEVIFSFAYSASRLVPVQARLFIQNNTVTTFVHIRFILFVSCIVHTTYSFCAIPQSQSYQLR